MQGALLLAPQCEDRHPAERPERLVRPFRPGLCWTTSLPPGGPGHRRGDGGPTAVWRPSIGRPPAFGPERHYRSPGLGALEHERQMHASRPIRDVTPSSWGCEDCLAQGRRDWVHLRICQECGHVGCCDNSPGRHATAHFRLAGHPVIRSYEPGEDWYWCYLDQLAFELEGAPPAPSHP